MAKYHPKRCTNLNFPPPLSGIDIAVNPHYHIRISVVSLGPEFQVWCKGVATIYLPNAFRDVPVENLEGFALNHDLLLPELWAKRW